MKQFDNHTDRTEALLARALREEAAQVEPKSDALQAIQRRTSGTAGARTPWPGTPGSRTPWLFGAMGAAVATAAVITAVVVIGDDAATSRGPAPAGTPSGGVVQQDGMHQGVYDPQASDEAQLTMHYVGPESVAAEESARRLPPRLYTETHTVEPSGGDHALAAVHEFLTSRPIDRDYESGWPEGVDVTSVTDDGDVTTIALAGDADLGTSHMDGYCLLDAGVAVQALLRTAGVEQAARFTYNDKPVAVLFNCVNVAPSVAVQSDDEVRAFITIDNIVEGQMVTSPVTVQVSGNVFEGNVNWVLSREGTKLDEGFVTTSMGTWKQADIDLGTLEPGTYTFKALEYSASDGSPINVDDKTFVVE